MPGLIGYDPSRTRELHRRTRRAAEHLLRTPPCDDPLADAAVSVTRLVKAHLEHDWLAALDRVLGSTAMLDFSDADVGAVASGVHGLRPLSTGHPAGGDADDSGPPASNSLDSELNPAATETPPEPSAPITGAVLPNGWASTCGPVSASTGQAASGCAWMPPTPWDIQLPLLVASFLPFTGEALDVYDCVKGDIPCELVAVPFVSGRGVNALDDILTGGARVADVRRSFDFTSEDSWAGTATLQKHFVKHGNDFGSTSAEHYASQASNFFDRAVTENLPTKIDPEDGTIRFWDPATNTFGSYNQDGETLTFFKPTSPNYWERQAG